jgi:hypothetical protein
MSEHDPGPPPPSPIVPPPDIPEITPVPLAEIERLRLEPGDLIVLRVHRNDMTAQDIERFAAIARQAFPTRLTAALGNDMTFEVVDLPGPDKDDDTTT